MGTTKLNKMHRSLGVLVDSHPEWVHLLYNSVLSFSGCQDLVDSGLAESDGTSPGFYRATDNGICYYGAIQAPATSDASTGALYPPHITTPKPAAPAPTQLPSASQNASTSPTRPIAPGYPDETPIPIELRAGDVVILYGVTLVVSGVPK